MIIRKKNASGAPASRGAGSRRSLERWLRRQVAIVRESAYCLLISQYARYIVMAAPVSTYYSSIYHTFFSSPHTHTYGFPRRLYLVVAAATPKVTKIQ